MVTIQHVEDSGLALLKAVIGPERSIAMSAKATDLRTALGNRTLWHVNSTASGGGVAEMLRYLIPLYRELGIDARWAVTHGGDRFLRLIKRIGLALYGNDGDGGPLGSAERDAYLDGLRPSGESLASMIRPGDIVVLHDHQTAGLVSALTRRGADVYWRCHVGVDEPTAASTRAWSMISPLLDDAHCLIFSVPWHVPPQLQDRDTIIVPPFLTPTSPKNRELSETQTTALLRRCGLLPGEPGDVPIVADAPPEPGAPLLSQVSRWDALKDMDGVLASFARYVPSGYLALVGPDPDGVPDDVEQAQWFERCRTAWRRLPTASRRRIALICLPMSDQAANALLVNAVQRASAVVLQKSLAEGFGLTVTEAMWKRRAVVASAAGGIRAQIDHGETGLLIDDPYDLAGFGALVTACLNGDVDTTAMGARAHDRVLREFLPDRDIISMSDMLVPRLR